MQAGLVQRVTALNRFIHDVYHGQDILRAGIVPAEQIPTTPSTGPRWRAWTCRNDIYAHIAGIDIVRAPMPRAKASTTCWKTTCACPAA
jgi:uncharacterized circularly permuted ATP-grasp superfamily protein